MTPLSTNYADRHRKTLIVPGPLPVQGQTVTVYIRSYEDPVRMTVLGVIADASIHTGATHTVFLSYAGRTYAGRYYNDGELAGIGQVEQATSYTVPTAAMRQFPAWRTSSQFLRSLRIYLTTHPA